MTKGEVCLSAVCLSCFSSTVRDFVNNRGYCIVCKCTEVLNADTCTLFIVFTMMWFGCFLMCVRGSGAVLQLRVVFSSPSSVQLL